MTHDDTRDDGPDETLVDLQCRFMDLELLVSELNEVVIELGAQLQQSERARRALSRRVDQLEAGANDPTAFN